MFRHVYCAIIAITVCVSFTSSINADLVYTIELTGTVGDITANDNSFASDDAAFKAILPFDEGAAVTAVYKYNSTPTDGSSNPNLGFYSGAGLSFHIAIGTTTFSHTDGNTLVHDNHSSQHDQLTHNASTVAAYADAINNTFAYSEFGSVARMVGLGFILRDNDETIFSSDEIPTSAFDFSDLEIATFEISDFHGTGGGSVWQTGTGSHSGRSHSISGSFSSMTFSTSVPEPSALLIFGIGMLMLTFRRRNPQLAG